MSQGSVLACIDGSHFSNAVCDYASWAANTLDAPLTLLHTIERQTATAPDMSGSIGMGSQQALLEKLTQAEQERSRLLIEQGQLMLEAAKSRVQALSVDELTLSQRHDGLANTMMDLEETLRLLVVGIRGEDHQGQANAIGGQLETLIRSLHKPILVVNSEFSAPKVAMIAYDGSEAANKAITMVATSPLLSNMACHLVHVSSQQKDRLQSEVMASAIMQLEQANIHVHSASLSGDVTQALCDYQERYSVDLTLMGAFSHNRLRDLLLGSFTTKMLTSANKPLLLLR